MKCMLLLFLECKQVGLDLNMPIISRYVGLFVSSKAVDRKSGPDF